MFTRLRRHLTYANIAATLAVVFAMSGGAYALSGGGHAPVASESSTRGRAAKAHKHVQGRSVVRGPAGPRGATGAPGAPGPVGTQGPQGAAGSQGPKGAAGTVGAKGEAGSPGTGGKNGEGVTATALAAKNGSGNCEAGGTEFKVGGHEPTYACNGEVASGSGYPEVMPSGRSVSGRWGVALAGFKYEEEIENPTTHEKEKVVAYEGQYGVASISFPIALSETQVSVIGSHSHYISKADEGNLPVGCQISATHEYIAEPGNLCIFQTEALLGELSTPNISVSNSGVVLKFFTLSKASAVDAGTWVMAAPVAE